MLLYKDIIKDDNLLLKAKSLDVSLPLSDEDKTLIKELNEYLYNGYDDEFIKKHDIRPGVGIAAPQIGCLKKIFAILLLDKDDEFENLIVINPKIISHSEELIYLESGEGCLSVDRVEKGFVHRYKRIKAKVVLYNILTDETKEEVISLSGIKAIVFQHEYDHLFGTLFTDKINKLNPFFIPENSKPIK